MTSKERWLVLVIKERCGTQLESTRVNVTKQGERAAFDRPVLGFFPLSVAASPCEKDASKAFAEIRVMVFDPEILDRNDPISIRFERAEFNRQLVILDEALPLQLDVKRRHNQGVPLDPERWLLQRDIP